MFIKLYWRLMIYEKMNDKLPTLKKQKLTKKSQDKEDEIKRNLYRENQSWNKYKFQIHWNKLQWVNPGSRI